MINLFFLDIHNLEVHQINVSATFLNDKLEEKIYMEQPGSFSIHGPETKVSKLDKSMCGLKKSPKQWHVKFDHMTISNEFKVNGSLRVTFSLSYVSI